MPEKTPTAAEINTDTAIAMTEEELVKFPALDGFHSD